MTRKFLEELGLEKEIVDKILDQNSADIGIEVGKLEDLQSKYQTETEQFKRQLSERDYADAVKRAIAEKGVKFSSKAAERAYVADLKAKALQLKDGALVGFDKYHEEQMAADPSAFASDKPAPFVKPIGPGGPLAVKSKGAMYAEQFNAQYAQTTK